MANIICCNCFAEFSPNKLWFKCLQHDDAFIFSWRGKSRTTPPPHAYCSQCHLQTGSRVCPFCKKDLPYYVGRLPQLIIAITGMSVTGKTAYLWALLHRIRERLAQDDDPFVVAMFEDDQGHKIYHDLDVDISLYRQVPELTDPDDAKKGLLHPVIVRLLQAGQSKKAIRNLILFDPSGELFSNLKLVQFLRYLTHAAAIIYLIEPPKSLDAEQNDELAARAHTGLNSIIEHIRRESALAGTIKLPQVLAMVVTKADRFLLPQYGEAALLPDHGKGQKFWMRRNYDETQVKKCGDNVRKILQQAGFSALTALANRNFAKHQYFAVSSLNTEPEDGILAKPAEPVGVDIPLFWILKQLG